MLFGEEGARLILVIKQLAEVAHVGIAQVVEARCVRVFAGYYLIFGVPGINGDLVAERFYDIPAGVRDDDADVDITVGIRFFYGV